ncbi:MAG: peroxiredoxin family protein [Burkholderiales bacterium]
MAQIDALTAPEWEIASWLNSPSPLRLAGLRGRVVVLHAFQMLCPGCVLHGIPQAQRVHDLFQGEAVQVVGLHTVFEHHEAMRDASLRAFVHEFRVTFPVGTDRHRDNDPLPLTMARYEMRGTPTLILIDRAGRLRAHEFGKVDDMALGARIARLLAEPSPT